MLSFSTCWNSSRHTNGEDLVREILDMGFDTIEISHGLSVSLLPGIKQAYERWGFKVSGLHNFCPSPVEVMIDAPDCYEYTSHRPYERERAVALTLKTLEYAKQFNASYVVLHMGSVPMKKMSKQLTTMVKEGKLNSRDYVKLKLKTIEMREKVAPLYMKRSKAALRLIAEKAEEVGIPVAVESRSKYEDLPSEREMIEIMEEFKDNPFVGYWHDFGHVQLKANLSMLSHYEWLKTMQPYLIGCHLHDVKWPARDHQVPLTGTIQYDKLIPLVDPAKPMVWELSPRRKKAEILECLPKWIERYGP